MIQNLLKTIIQQKSKLMDWFENNIKQDEVILDISINNIKLSTITVTYNTNIKSYVVVYNKRQQINDYTFAFYNTNEPTKDILKLREIIAKKGFIGGPYDGVKVEYNDNQFEWFIVRKDESNGAIRIQSSNRIFDGIYGIRIYI